MRIQKILIKNFKNVKGTKVIDFQDNVTLFVGPNGFGKTTIFDAIELSLTGKIRRITESDYTDGRSRFSSAYFQNDPNKDTLIKLMLVNDKGETLTVSSRYKSSSNSNGNNVPQYSFSQFKRNIKFNSEKEFEKIEDVESIDDWDEKDIQKAIGEFLGYESEDYSLSETFDLFHYIQQDETAYYLKQKEKDRKEQLNFLLNIESYVNKKNQLDNLRKTLVSNKKELETKKKKFQNLSTANKIPYTRLSLRTDIDFPFNREVIVFDDELSEVSLDGYLQEVEKLQKFRNSFSPKDYLLRQQSEQFEREIKENSDFTDYLLFREIFENQEEVDFIKQNHSLISNEKNYSYFLLKNYIEQLEYLENNRKLFEQGKILERLFDVEIDEINMETIEKSLNNFSEWEFGKIWLEQFKPKFTNYNIKKRQLNDGTTSINKLLEIRSRLKEHSEEHNSKCLFCGYDWIESEQLLNAYEETTQQFRKNLSTLEVEIANFVQELNQLIMDLKTQITVEQEKLFVLPKDFLEEIRSIRKYNFPDDFNNLVSETSDISPMSIESTVSLQGFKMLKKELLDLLQKKLLLPKEIYNSFLRIMNRKADFETLLEKYSVLRSDVIREFQLAFQILPISLYQLQENREQVSIFLDDISSSIVFDFSKTLDPQNLFDVYFTSDKKIFEACTIESINKKRDYIINQFEIQSLTQFNLIEKRLQIINQTVNYLRQRIGKLDSNIKDYQVQMIKKLKLPFYIYTAKILQNYQQGMGVLLTTQNNSNIRFLANSNSEQDVMYQLSSGQVAVISFAFTLALNTTFKISKDFKLLTIDDPIQDMDSMNVYALIDLLRHALPDYQILMSTHNDGSAMFIKYKFELFSDLEISKVGLKNIKDIILVDDQNLSDE